MYNPFRIAGDFLHVLALIILLVKLLRSKSCENISGKTQILYAIMFTTRYSDLLSAHHYHSYYASTMKIAFIAVSYLIVYLIYGPYKKTYDRENDTMFNEFLVVPCFTLALFFNEANTPIYILWAFSIYLEAIAIIPQLELLSRIQVVDNYTVCYLISIGLYRAFYILNWAYRYYDEGFYEVITLYSGFVQTALFALVFVFIFILKRREKRAMLSVIV